MDRPDKRRRMNTGGSHGLPYAYVANNIEVGAMTDSEKLNFMCSKMCTVENLQAQVSQNTTRLNDMETSVDDLALKFAIMEERLDSVECRSIDQEARAQRCNLIFTNIPEPPTESYQDCEYTLLDFIRNFMNVGDYTNDIVFQRVHRLGKKRYGVAPDGNAWRPRPIIAMFRDYKLKELVLRYARNLKNTPHSVQQSFPAEIRSARGKLWSDLNRAKANHSRASIVYPAKLIVDGRVVRDELPDWEKRIRGLGAVRAGADNNNNNNNNTGDPDNRRPRHRQNPTLADHIGAASFISRDNQRPILNAPQHGYAHTHHSHPPQTENLYVPGIAPTYGPQHAPPYGRTVAPSPIETSIANSHLQGASNMRQPSPLHPYGPQHGRSHPPAPAHAPAPTPATAHAHAPATAHAHVHAHTHAHAPAPAPGHAPAHAPAHGPAHGPTHAPAHAPAHAHAHAPPHAPAHAHAHAPEHAPEHALAHAPAHAPLHAPAHAPASAHAPTHAPTHAPSNLSYEQVTAPPQVTQNMPQSRWVPPPAPDAHAAVPSLVHVPSAPALTHMPLPDAGPVQVRTPLPSHSTNHFSYPAHNIFAPSLLQFSPPHRVPSHPTSVHIEDSRMSTRADIPVSHSHRHPNGGTVQQSISTLPGIAETLSSSITMTGAQ